MRGRKFTLTLLLALAMLLPAASAEKYYNAKLGEWVEFVPDDPDAAPAEAETDREGLVRGYLRLSQGTYLYRDPGRTEPFAEPREASVFYAVRVGEYEKGSVYELRFDTPATVNDSQYSRAYFYTRNPDVVKTRSALSQIESVRVAEGAVIPLVRLYYDITPPEPGDGFGVTAMSGDCWALHDGTNIRKGPGRDTYAAVAQAARGEKLAIEGSVVNGVGVTWYLVRSAQGRTGFVRADLVTRTQPETPAPEAEPEETPDPESVNLDPVRSDTVALMTEDGDPEREDAEERPADAGGSPREPDEESEFGGTPEGAGSPEEQKEAGAAGEEAPGAVDPDGTDGENEETEEGGDPAEESAETEETVPEERGPEAGTGEGNEGGGDGETEETGDGEAPEAGQEAGTDEGNEDGGDEETEETGDGEAPEAGQTRTLLSETPLRAAPDEEGEILLVCPAGTELTVLGAEGGWLFVRAEEAEGYVSLGSLPEEERPAAPDEADEPAEEATEPGPDAEGEPEAEELEAGQTRTLLSETPLRAAPDEEGGILLVCPAGTELTVLEPGAEWIRVQREDVEGYIPRAALLPAREEAPEAGAPEDEAPAEEAPALAAELTADASFARAGGEVRLTAAVRGGTPPYAIIFTAEAADEPFEIGRAESVLPEDGEDGTPAGAGTVFVPERAGLYTLTAVVTDGAGETRLAEAALEVADDASESEAEWERSAETGLTGDWAHDLVAVARTQVGYSESDTNYILKEDGTRPGYTRYGAFIGAQYTDWCAAFVSFCVRYARLPLASDFRSGNVGTLKEQAAALGAWHAEPDYAPRAGDVVFLRAGGHELGHIGIVSDAGEGGIGTIQGNVNRSVVEKDYDAGDPAITGYMSLADAQARLGAAERGPEMPAVRFEMETGGLKVAVEAPEGAFPAGTQMRLAPVDEADESLVSAVGRAVGEQRVARIRAVDITFLLGEEEIEPLVPIRVTMTAEDMPQTASPVLVHIDDAGEAAVMDAAPEADETGAPAGGVVFESGAFSTYALVETVLERTLEIDGQTYKVTVTFGSDAGIPEDAGLVVSEADPEDYLAEMGEALELGEDGILFYTKCLDIAFVRDGEEIEPQAPVDVKVELLDVTEGGDQLQVVHFAEDGAKRVEGTAEEDGTVSFRAEGFSVYGFGSVLRAAEKAEAGAADITVLSYTGTAPALAEAETAPLEEGLEVVRAFSLEGEKAGGLFLAAALNGSVELEPRESVSLCRVEAGCVAEPLAEELTAERRVVRLDGEAEGFAVVRDSGYRRLSFELNPEAPESGTEPALVTLDGLMPKESQAEAADVTAAYADFAAPAEAPAGSPTAPAREPEAAGLAARSAIPDEAPPAGEDDREPEEPERAPSEQGGQRAKVLAAFDITILSGGEAYQPDGEHPVAVAIRDGRLRTESPVELWHIPGEGSPERVLDFTLEDGVLRFDASGFSVYAIVEAPEPLPFGWASVSDEADIGGGAFYLSHNSYYLTDRYEQAAQSGGTETRYGLSGTAQYTGTGVPEDAAEYHFAKADDGTYAIWVNKDGARQYVKMTRINNDQAGLSFTADEGEKTAFEITDAGNSLFKIRAAVGGRTYYWNRNAKTLGFGAFVGYSNGNDNNVAKLRFQYHADTPDDAYGLDGKTFGIAYHNDSVTAAAVMSEAAGAGRLAAEDMLMRPDVVNHDGILLVAEGSDITEWTFESIEEDRYYIKTEVGGETKYLTIEGAAVSLADDPTDAAVISAVPGTGENSGKWHFTAGGYSLCLPGNVKAGFGAAKGNGAVTWLNLVQKSSLSDDDFTRYTARKVSVSDTLNVHDGQEVILYTRLWNDQTERYEFWAVDCDGSLVRCYDAGDNIEWIGSRVNTALWKFTEYRGSDGTPNYYYELQNAQYGNYIAPQVTGGQILSDKTIGINLNGRRYGRNCTTVIAWDDHNYAYAGLRTENGRVVSCPLSKAEDFYFAVMNPVEPVEDHLTEVETVDSEAYGISLRMTDFNNEIKDNRDSGQTAAFGFDTNLPGMLTTGLSGGPEGYPSTVSAVTGEPSVSLGELFTGGSVNHLFLKSIYNESGYFEYDSTQNFAHLNGDGDFTVYDQLGAIGNYPGASSGRRTGAHGQFMPYDDLTEGKHVAAFANETDVQGYELPDTDARKGETLYDIGTTKEVDYFFGMEMTAEFTQTPSGKDAWGHDIVFEFSGDDDFWFYVDGELVLDLGGVHSAMTGSINFRTGAVRSTRGNTTIRALFKEHFMSRDGMSEEEAEEKLNTLFDGQAFRDYSTHTMRMFYMERGAGASNLHMRFNLAAVKPGTFLLSKTLSGTDSGANPLIEFPYQIYYSTESAGEDHYIQLSEKDYVKYKDRTTFVPYRESYTPPGGTKAYSHVFFLKPGETAEVMLPDKTINYYVVECGVNPAVYEKVWANGEQLAGTQAGSFADYAVPAAKLKNRNKVDYVNQVRPGAMRTLSITKRLYDQSGERLVRYPEDETGFSFRLYLGNEGESSLPPALNYPYFVKDPDGNYCRWDASRQKFVSLGITDYEELARYLSGLSGEEKDAIVFVTSQNGSISRIPADHTVEVRDLVVGTMWEAEERDGELPKGYTRRTKDGYTRMDRNPPEESGTPFRDAIGAGEDPEIEVRNQMGWGLTAKKVWTDRDFMEAHDPIYFAIYLNGELVDGSVRQLKAPDTEVYYFFEDLLDGAGGSHKFSEYMLREVTIGSADPDVEDGVVQNPGTVTPIGEGGTLTLGGTPVGGAHSEGYVYTVGYKVGEMTGRNENVRTDTVTNSRPGIGIYKTDWDGASLAGAAFTLTDAAGRDVAAASYRSGSDGLVTTAYLPAGEYTLTEIEAPDGFAGLNAPLTIAFDGEKAEVSGADPSLFTVSTDDPAMIAVLTIRNRPSAFQVRKTDDFTGKAVSGAHFALYPQVTDHHGHKIKDYKPKAGFEDVVTDENGILPGVTMGLGAGTYYLTETQPAQHYKLLEEDLCFTIGRDGTVSIEAESQKGWLTEERDPVTGTTAYVIAVPNTRIQPRSVQVKKTFAGDIASEDVPADFRIVYKDSTGAGPSGALTGPNAEKSEDGLVWNWLLEDIEAGTVMTFTEESYAAPGYAVVPDAEEKTLTVDEDAELNKVAFENRYSLGSLTVTKLTTGDDDRLTDAQKAGIAFRVAGPDGYGEEFAWTDMAEENGGRAKELTGLRLGEYTVTETSSGADLKGYAVTTSVRIGTDAPKEGDAGTLALDAEHLRGSAVFTNHYVYSAEGSAELSVRKTLSGGRLTPRAFTFELTDEDGNVLQTVQNAANGAIPFRPIAYTQRDAGKTFRYTVREVIPTPPEKNVIYDEHELGITVAVTDNGDGTLTADVGYSGETVFTNVRRFTLTVRYFYADSGATAAPTVVEIHFEGDKYRIVSPVIPGYTANRPVVEGVMPARDLVIDVYYLPQTPPPDPDPDPDPRPDPDPDPDNPEFTVIGEVGVPLGLGALNINAGECLE